MPNADPDRFPRGSDIPEDNLASFLNLLNMLKSRGCSLLVVGDDVPRRFFTRASSRMLGDDEEVRYRALAVTDATPQSIVDRLPDPEVAPRPITETTHVLNHVGALRSVTAATDADAPVGLTGVSETRIADPELAGLQSALFDAVDDFALQSHSVRPADIRVGIDSLDPLLDFHGEDVVRHCLRNVGDYVREFDAMAHYVLPKAYDSEIVQALALEVDAVVELRVADAGGDGPAAEQRWHVPSRDLSVEWTAL